MFKDKWYFIVAGVLALIYVVKGWLHENDRNGLIDDFRNELQRRVRIRRKEAIEDAEKKHEHAVDSDIDDWLDDELGSGFGGPS